MELFTAAVNMVPNLVADLSPKEKASITKFVVVTTGVYALGKYFIDKYFAYLEGKPISAHDTSVALTEPPLGNVLTQPATA